MQTKTKHADKSISLAGCYVSVLECVWIFLSFMSAQNVFVMIQEKKYHFFFCRNFDRFFKDSEIFYFKKSFGEGNPYKVVSERKEIRYTIVRFLSRR